MGGSYASAWHPGNHAAQCRVFPLPPGPAGVVLTVEPALYVPDDETYGPLRGIGVRIEDDVAITGGEGGGQKGPEARGWDEPTCSTSASCVGCLPLHCQARARVWPHPADPAPLLLRPHHALPGWPALQPRATRTCRRLCQWRWRKWSSWWAQRCEGGPLLVPQPGPSDPSAPSGRSLAGRSPLE